MSKFNRLQWKNDIKQIKNEISEQQLYLQNKCEYEKAFDESQFTEWRQNLDDMLRFIYKIHINR